MRRRLFFRFCVMSIVAGVDIVIARPFMPFDGMLLIAVGLILPMQVILLRWLQTKLKDSDRQ